MRKIIIFNRSIFILLVIAVMNLLLFSSLFASETGRIRKHICAYGAAIDQQKAEFIASHFDLADVDFFNAAGMAIVKSLNPDIIVVGYRSAVGIHDDKYQHPDWPEINSHEEWFTHDKFGHRLMDDTWMSYLMDPGSEGWRNHYAQDLKSRLDTYLMFDGVFADDVNKTLSVTRWHIDLKNEPAVVKSDGSVDIFYPIWTDSKNKISIYDNMEGSGENYYTGGSYSGKTITLGTALPEGTQVYINYSAKDANQFRPIEEKVNSWHSDIVNLLKTAKAAIGEKLLILNSGYGSSDYLDASDGTMVEGFVHASWYSEGYFVPFYQWQEHIDYLDSIAGTDKILLAQSGINKNIGTDEEDARMMLYCFGSYLLGAGENTSFYFENGGYSSPIYYYSDLWDISLGKPVNRYYLLSQGYSGYPADIGENLVVNPSYEQGMAGWKVMNWQNTVNLAIDNSIFKAGNNSMKISVDSGINTGGSLQHVSLEPFTAYTLNGWVNAEDLQSSAYTAALLVIYGGIDTDSGKNRSISDGLRPGTEGWRYISTTMTTPDNTSGAYIFAGQIVSAKAGAAWFDDIKLVKGTEYKVFSRDFEKGKVLVNPMYGSAEVELEGRYKTLEGDVVTEVTIGGHHAIILIKDDSGDIDADGDVDVLDVQLCVNVVLGVETGPEAVDRVSKAAEPEDKYDVADVQMVVNAVLGE